MNPIKSFYQPTPVFWRKLGDSVLLFGTTMTATLAGLEIHKGWIIASAIVTALGKFITNVAKED